MASDRGRPARWGPTTMTCMVDSGVEAPYGKVRLLYHPAVMAISHRPSRFSELTGDQLKAKLAEHSISQEQFARIIRIAPSTVRRWIAGSIKIPYIIDLVLELLEVKPEMADRARGSRGRRPSRDSE